MKAIEIYQKINEIVEKEDPTEASIALEFVQREVNNRRYASEAIAKNALCGSVNYVDPEARAVALVRQVVREELQAAAMPFDEEKAEKAA